MVILELRHVCHEQMLHSHRLAAQTLHLISHESNECWIYIGDIIAIGLMELHYYGSDSAIERWSILCRNLTQDGDVKTCRLDQYYSIVGLRPIHPGTFHMIDAQRLSTGMLSAKHLQKAQDLIVLDEKLEKEHISIIRPAAFSQKGVELLRVVNCMLRHCIHTLDAILGPKCPRLDYQRIHRVNE